VVLPIVQTNNIDCRGTTVLSRPFNCHRNTSITLQQQYIVHTWNNATNTCADWQHTTVSHTLSLLSSRIFALYKNRKCNKYIYLATNHMLDQGFQDPAPHYIW